MPIYVMHHKPNDGSAHNAAVSVSFEHGIPQAGVIALLSLDLGHLLPAIANIPIVFLFRYARMVVARISGGIAALAQSFCRVLRVRLVAFLATIEPP